MHTHPPSMTPPTPSRASIASSCLCSRRRLNVGKHLTQLYYHPRLLFPNNKRSRHELNGLDSETGTWISGDAVSEAVIDRETGIADSRERWRRVFQKGRMDGSRGVEGAQVCADAGSGQSCCMHTLTRTDTSAAGSGGAESLAPPTSNAAGSMSSSTRISRLIAGKHVSKNSSPKWQVRHIGNFALTITLGPVVSLFDGVASLQGMKEMQVGHLRADCAIDVGVSFGAKDRYRLISGDLKAYHGPRRRSLTPAQPPVACRTQDDSRCPTQGHKRRRIFLGRIQGPWHDHQERWRGPFLRSPCSSFACRSRRFRQLTKFHPTTMTTDFSSASGTAVTIEEPSTGTTAAVLTVDIPVVVTVLPPPRSNSQSPSLERQ
ncbi:hypothetical protein IW261DRAFT_1572210 [Armillaria novae-zelandiae]|uniref:Uncharacterized protein n=1 Tax=Armillaria novae-zelandiae TaxID=153914 RepID=A0AA39NTE1_9AGAR|nr:hypothetical protein IW261DRAFT_1572210 [Armillaria novae-zelandiae]